MYTPSTPHRDGEPLQCLLCPQSCVTYFLFLQDESQASFAHSREPTASHRLNYIPNLLLMLFPLVLTEKPQHPPLNSAEKQTNSLLQHRTVNLCARTCFISPMELSLFTSQEERQHRLVLPLILAVNLTTRRQSLFISMGRKATFCLLAGDESHP